MRRFFVFVSLFLIFIFGFVGCLFIGTVLHEYSHMNDFRSNNIQMVNESIRINIPLDYYELIDGAAGVYSFRPTNLSQVEELKEINSYTEWKAYAISIFILALFIYSFFFICVNFYEFKEIIFRKWN